MRTKKILFYCLAALMGGCVPIMSLRPLFTSEDLVFDEKLLGTYHHIAGEAFVQGEKAGLRTPICSQETIRPA